MFLGSWGRSLQHLLFSALAYRLMALDYHCTTPESVIGKVPGTGDRRQCRTLGGGSGKPQCEIIAPL